MYVISLFSVALVYYNGECYVIDISQTYSFRNYASNIGMTAHVIETENLVTPLFRSHVPYGSMYYVDNEDIWMYGICDQT